MASFPRDARRPGRARQSSEPVAAASAAQAQQARRLIHHQQPLLPTPYVAIDMAGQQNTRPANALGAPSTAVSVPLLLAPRSLIACPRTRADQAARAPPRIRSRAGERSRARPSHGRAPRPHRSARRRSLNVAYGDKDMAHRIGRGPEEGAATNTSRRTERFSRSRSDWSSPDARAALHRRSFGLSAGPPALEITSAEGSHCSLPRLRVSSGSSTRPDAGAALARPISPHPGR
jgi:hypothetical protein